MPTEYRIADPSQLAIVLRSFRHARQLTQAQLAERLGIAQQSYARMESHPAATSVSNLMKMLGTLGIDLVLHDRTPMSELEQPDQAPRPKKSASKEKQTQDASAKPLKSEKTSTKKPARRLTTTSITLKAKGGDAQMRTGQILPLTSKKDW